jgi:hypothetical protein
MDMNAKSDRCGIGGFSGFWRKGKHCRVHCDLLVIASP